MGWEIRRKGDVWERVPHDDVICEWEIAREGSEETQKVEVIFSRTAWDGPGDNTTLLDAKASEGRSVVQEFLREDDPPTMIQVNTLGIRALDK